MPAFVIGASVGCAVCVMLCGMYVLYRRRTKLARKKIAAKKITGRFVVSGDMSVLDSPPAPVVVGAVSQWKLRDPQHFNRRQSDEHVSIVTTARNRVRSLSAVSSASFYMSSLHTSERSVISSVADYGEVECGDEVTSNRNYQTEHNVINDQIERSESSVYSDSSSEDHSSSDSSAFEYFDFSSDTDLNA